MLISLFVLAVIPVIVLFMLGYVAYNAQELLDGSKLYRIKKSKSGKYYSQVRVKFLGCKFWFYIPEGNGNVDVKYFNSITEAENYSDEFVR